MSRLDGTELTVVKELDDPSIYKMQGSCSTMSNEFVFVCFALEANLCFRADSPLGKFDPLEPSHNSHEDGAISTSESEYLSVY